MREILFRGKSIEHLGWEEGDLITSFGKTYIGNTVGNDRDNWCEVDLETVGQFTGLLDKNGKKIFEGDTVKTKYGRKCIVKWFQSPNSVCWDLKAIDFDKRFPDDHDIYLSSNLEIVTNIHDNQELIKQNDK